MGRVIFVTGFKGGVGKTTVAANLASALYALGKHVLVIDGDFGMRCMDLVLGLESDALFDCSDVLSGRCSAGAAMSEVKSTNGFSFISAPINLTDEKFPSSAYYSLISEVRPDYDFIIIDSCAELTDYYRSFAEVSDEALVVTLHQSTSVRAAEKTATRLVSLGINEISLVVNGYRADDAEKGYLPDIPSIIGRSSVKLIGVVPYDKTIPATQEASELAFSGNMRKKARSSESAFLNIAKRLCGIRVPLTENVEKPLKRNKYTGIIIKDQEDKQC